MVGSIAGITEFETTGRQLVLFRERAIDAGINTLRDYTGRHGVARAADFDCRAVTAEQLDQTDTIVFDDLGVAVCMLDPEQLQSLHRATDESSAIALIEPERVVYTANEIGFSGTVPTMSRPITNLMQLTPSLATSNLSVEYLQGYRDGVNEVINRLVPTNGNGAQRVVTVPGLQAIDETTATWGLQVTKVVNSRYSGRGVKVAVLDTGIDFTHPDFTGRGIIGKSFITQEDVQDRNGHGTHCIGTACGPLHPGLPPRYGIGYEAEIFAGKVLSNQGRGFDRGILAGIQWAFTSGCKVISMSLGAAVSPGQPYSDIFEVVAARLLRGGCLIVAAAGNESDRPGTINPVGHPANCPSIMAVAALDAQLQVARFSNGGLNPDGGQIDIIAPGVDIYSSYPMPTRYRRLRGTSMATPHVAGIAALYAEATGLTGNALWNLLTQKALRLPLSSVDVGTGLVQAP